MDPIALEPMRLSRKFILSEFWRRGGRAALPPLSLSPPRRGPWEWVDKDTPARTFTMRIPRTRDETGGLGAPESTGRFDA